MPLEEIRDMTGQDLILKLLQALDAVARLHGDTKIVPETKTLIASEAA